MPREPPRKLRVYSSDWADWVDFGRGLQAAFHYMSSLGWLVEFEVVTTGQMQMQPSCQEKEFKDPLE